MSNNARRLSVVLVIGGFVILGGLQWWSHREPAMVPEGVAVEEAPRVDIRPTSDSAPDHLDALRKRFKTDSAPGVTEPFGRPVVTAEPAPSVPLREPVRLLLARPYRVPSAEKMRAIGPEDADTLLASYRSEPNLTNRLAAAFGLAKTGDRRALDVFKHTLGSEFTQQRLGGDEVRTMLKLVDLVGLLARSNDDALEYLLGSLSAEAWRQPERRRWEVDAIGYEEIDEWLAGESIRAIGMSGRQEGMNAVLELAQLPAAESVLVASSIVDAVFFQAHWEAHGTDPEFVASFSKDMAEASLRWTMETEQGQQWFEWFKKINAMQTP